MRYTTMHRRTLYTYGLPLCPSMLWSSKLCATYYYPSPTIKKYPFTLLRVFPQTVYLVGWAGGTILNTKFLCVCFNCVGSRVSWKIFQGSWWNGFGFTRVHFTQGEPARPCCRLAKKKLWWKLRSWEVSSAFFQGFRFDNCLDGSGRSVLIGCSRRFKLQTCQVQWIWGGKWCQSMSKCHSSKWLTNLSETLGPLGPLDLIWILTNSCNKHHKHEHKDLTRQWDSIPLAFFPQYLTFRNQ